MKNTRKHNRSIRKFLSTLLVCTLLMTFISNTFITATAIGITQAEEKVNVYFDTIDESTFSALTANAAQYDVSVFIEFAFSETEMAEIDQILLTKDRVQAKNFFGKLNRVLSQITGVDEDAFSDFAPFAEVVFDSLDEYYSNESRIYTIATSDLIRDIDVSLVQKEDDSSTSEIAATISSSYPVFTITDAYNDINIKENGYYGDGIKVGFIEEGAADRGIKDPDTGEVTPVLEDISQEYVNNLTENTVSTTAYALGTLSLMTGAAAHSMIQDATFVFAPLDNTGSYKNSLDALIAYGVDIVYAYQEDGYVTSGAYTNSCAYVDYIIQAYDCLVIQGAGEDSNSTGVMSPGVSFNGITVGASTKNRRVASFSNSGLAQNLESLVYKPDLLAPGAAIYGIPHYSMDTDLDQEGTNAEDSTRFSAALVTCAAVKLMDEFSVLKYNAHLLKTVLLAGCDKVSNHQGFLDPDAGAGIVDYNDSRNLMLNGEYKTFTKQSNGTVNSEFAIVLGAGETATFYYTSMFPGSNASSNDNTHSFAFTIYNIGLKDPQQTVTVDSTSIFRPSGTFVLENTTDSPMVLSLKVETTQNVHSGRTEYIALLMDCPTHTHSYSQAAHATSTTSHMLYCSCGAKKTAAHVSVAGATHLCETCGYDDSTQMYDTHVHNFVTYSNYNSTTHKLSCACGEYVTGAHVKDSNGNCILCPDA